MTGSRSPTAGVPGPHGGRPVVAAGAPRGAAEAAVVALHGRGATARGIVDLLEPVRRHGVAFLAPEADRSRWYPYAAAAPIERNEPELSAAVAVVDALVDRAGSAAGVPRDRVVVLGFSQGGCVAAEYAAREASSRLGGVVVLSGTLPGASIGADGYAGDLEGTPVLVAGGGDDPRLPPDRLRGTAAVLRSLGGDVTERVYDGVGHEVTDDEFAFVDALLARLVDDD